MAATEAKARIKISKLLEEKGFPLLVLEAKPEDKIPEQVKDYVSLNQFM